MGREQKQGSRGCRKRRERRGGEGAEYNKDHGLLLSATDILQKHRIHSAWVSDMLAAPWPCQLGGLMFAALLPGHMQRLMSSSCKHAVAPTPCCVPAHPQQQGGGGGSKSAPLWCLLEHANAGGGTQHTIQGALVCSHLGQHVKEQQRMFVCSSLWGLQNKPGHSMAGLCSIYALAGM